ncbi:MAG: acetyl-CoA carboxylase biotin carboxyl carrier protein subunit [Bacteroidales bacterium]|jgi:biotin carboxyl carrier protein|nr:acetyl-CoA carboxylase biotin carboxyl carrier protein subunit [Bacteroidales bacterium]
MSKTETTNKTTIQPEPIQRYVMRKVFTAVNANHITAFMPGTVGQIFVKKGEKVSKGQNLVILHCMKMDNELLAPFDAKVKSINVKTGENVVKNHVLVELE